MCRVSPPLYQGNDACWRRFGQQNYSKVHWYGMDANALYASVFCLDQLTGVPRLWTLVKDKLCRVPLVKGKRTSYRFPSYVSEEEMELGQWLTRFTPG